MEDSCSSVCGGTKRARISSSSLKYTPTQKTISLSRLFSHTHKFSLFSLFFIFCLEGVFWVFPPVLAESLLALGRLLLLRGRGAAPASAAADAHVSFSGRTGHEQHSSRPIAMRNMLRWRKRSTSFKKSLPLSHSYLPFTIAFFNPHSFFFIHAFSFSLTHKHTNSLWSLFSDDPVSGA
jgi:hypothetical protein